MAISFISVGSISQHGDFPRSANAVFNSPPIEFFQKETGKQRPRINPLSLPGNPKDGQPIRLARPRNIFTACLCDGEHGPLHPRKHAGQAKMK